MKVMVTGGTGFVGCHTVAELIKNGHEVKLLVRKPERVQPTLKPFGITPVDAVTGDVTDPKTVREAARGCDATIHCGSVYSLDPRLDESIRRTNITGTKTVIETALDLGHDPVVHVSSFVALIGQKCAVLTPACEPGTPRGTYFKSKADSDRVARDFQNQGAPVVISYPGSVWGPYDPHLGESCQMATSILKRLWSVTPMGIVCISDVRDLAKMHAAIIEKGRGPRRYIAPAHNISVKEAMSIISSVTGRKLPTLSLPAGFLFGPMKALDYLQTHLSIRLPVNFQAVYCVGLASKMDDSDTSHDFGIESRSLEETFADTIRWMVEAGHLSPHLAGVIAKTR